MFEKNEEEECLCYYTHKIVIIFVVTHTLDIITLCLDLFNANSLNPSSIIS
jgi:hypothetical protein